MPVIEREKKECPIILVVDNETEKIKVKIDKFLTYTKETLMKNRDTYYTIKIFYVNKGKFSTDNISEKKAEYINNMQWNNNELVNYLNVSHTLKYLLKYIKENNVYTCNYKLITRPVIIYLLDENFDGFVKDELINLENNVIYKDAHKFFVLFDNCLKLGTYQTFSDCYMINYDNANEIIDDIVSENLFIGMKERKAKSIKNTVSLNIEDKVRNNINKCNTSMLEINFEHYYYFENEYTSNSILVNDNPNYINPFSNDDDDDLW